MARQECDYYGGEIYSTNEIVVGTWIDGKPIYRKTLVMTKTATGDRQSIDVTSLNIAFIVDVYGTWFRSNGAILSPIANPDNSTTWQTGWYYTASDKKIILLWGSEIKSSLQTAYVVVEYTKTTD